ncbi:MAG: hypothetical protein H6540_07985 [Bacteroidales bacterium]|nr:hypothetical protein [Bacteroidales bacterium]
MSFQAKDGLMVDADLYTSKKSNPFIILLHQDESCKAEFDSLAPRFVKMNFNCLAVSLRSGDRVGYAKNETGVRAREEGFSYALRDGSMDIEAAINYIYDLSGKKVSLLGSGSSASLALKIGRDNDKVNSVVALSPGEYFSSDFSLNDILKNFPKPIFVACTLQEAEYLTGIEGFPDHDKQLFKPSQGKGYHGTTCLERQNPGRDEYWLALLLFYKSLENF